MIFQIKKGGDNLITIDLIYAFPIILSIIAILGMYLEKVNWFIALMGIVIGFGLTYYIAPYTAIIMGSLSNSLWYGYSWGLFEYLGLIHLITICIMSAIAIYNLYMSNGKKLWG